MTRTQRVWCIIRMLREREWTVTELAAEFRVAERTIYDDLILIQTEPFYQPVRRRVVHMIANLCQG